ncbi:MAG: ABC transporter ATP-binding protein [Lachnospiraceae bacterium]|nr:ABC transporter ATP-binding protein [Lachnospiraceae bacterium]
MAEIRLENVSKTFNSSVKAIRNLSLTIPDGEFLVLLGPSGCGKTTLLRLVSGLEKPTEGRIFFDGVDMTEQEPMARNVAMVFQTYALYPHLTVYKNIAFPLKSKHMKAPEIDKRVMEAAKALDIEYLLNRRPRVLSGGQRQRVALARAIVREPSVFLLDEPLSNLDVKMRQELREVILNLHEKLGTTFIYVTHDQTEAMQMGSRIVVMNSGLLQQIGSPQEVYNYPASVFTGTFIGAPKMNLFASRMKSVDTVSGESGGKTARWSVSLMGNRFALPAERVPYDDPEFFEGKPVILGVRPEDFKEDGDPDQPYIEAKALKVVPMGANLHIEAECNGKTFMTVRDNHTPIEPGDTLRLPVNRWCVHIFDALSEKALCKSVYKELRPESGEQS